MNYCLLVLKIQEAIVNTYTPDGEIDVHTPIEYKLHHINSENIQTHITN